jgi:hypothetical protein
MKPSQLWSARSLRGGGQILSALITRLYLAILLVG